MRDVISTQKAKNASPGRQKKRLSPVEFNTRVVAQAQRYPSITVIKNGGR
jgi:hypothetical protein